MLEFSWSVRFRYLIGAAGTLTSVTVIFVAMAPFWRNTAHQISADLYDSVVAFEGLWLTCLFQARQVQCIEMGVGWSQAYGFNYALYISRIMCKYLFSNIFMILVSFRLLKFNPLLNQFNLNLSLQEVNDI